MFLKPIFLLAATLLVAAPHDPLPDLKLGDTLPKADHKMMDVTGKEHDLKTLAKQNGLLVIFTCNTCPYVVGNETSEGWEGRYPELGFFVRKHGVGLAFINSNEAKRNDGDGLADMRQRFTDKQYNHYYLLDKDHVMADAFGARTTPHVFLFNKDLELVYKGAIDDSVESAAAVKQHYVRDAVENLAAGKPIDPAQTRNIGCSIKRMPHKH